MESGRPRNALRISAVTAALAISVVIFSGCAAVTGPSTTGKLQVVASTNVWADVAREIGGDAIDVKGLIAGANKDPHSYEATAMDQLSVNKANLIIENGGGYDDFMGQLESAAPKHVPILTAFRQGDTNEHLWYSFKRVKEFAQQIETELAKQDPKDAAKFATNLSAFGAKLDALQTRADAVITGVAGIRILETEPVADHLLSNIGFINATLLAFSKAIEEERDAPPSAMAQIGKLLDAKEIRFVAFNVQTTGAQSLWIANKAQQNGVPVLRFSELVPAGENYLSWMAANLNQIEGALK